MKLSSTVIAYQLKHHDPRLYLSKTEKLRIKNMKFAEKEQARYDPAYIYLGKAEDFPDKIISDKPINIICIGGDEAWVEKKKDTPVNLILLDESSILESIANEIQDIFTFFNDWDEKLRESLIKFKGLQHLIDVSFPVFKNPMYLIDPSFRTLSFSKNVSPDAIDELWESIVLNGHTDLATVNSMKESDTLSWLNSCHEPIINASPIFTRRRINANIMNGAEKIGTLIIIENDTKLDTAHLHLAEHLAETILIALQKDTVYQNTSGALYKSFIADLLAGKSYKKSFIEQQLKFLDWSLNDHYFLVKIKIGEHDLINETTNYISHRLEAIFRGSRSIIYQKHIILIVNVGKKGILQDASINQLFSFLKDSKIKAAISSCFDNFSELSEYYQQASVAIELSDLYDNGQYLLKYEDYIIDHLLMTASQNMDITKICHPALLILLAYDQKNGTNYYHDLRVYIRNHKSLVNSAKELYIHRNTFVYRINKIMKIVSLDFSDHNLEAHLLLSYKLLDYLRVANGKH